MGHLIFVVITLVLLAGFFVLTNYEERRGVRVFGEKRGVLDAQVEQIEFVLVNVDFKSFAREELHRIYQKVMHTVAHISLTIVRSAERFLTRLVKRIRMERTVDTSTRENAREFVKTLSDFKDQLKETVPEVPDVLE